MGKLQNFISNLKKPAKKETPAPKAPAEPKKLFKKPEPKIKFDNIYFVVSETPSGSEIPAISVVPYALSGEWKITNLLTGKSKNCAPDTLYGMYECDKATIDSEVKRIFGDGKKVDVYTSSEAVASIMALGRRYAPKQAIFADPYNIYSKNPNFAKLPENVKIAEIAKHTAKTKLPLRAVVKQAENLGSMLHLDALDRHKADLERQLKESEERLKELERIEAETAKTPKNANSLLGGKTPMLHIPQVKTKTSSNTLGQGHVDNGIIEK